MSSMSAAISQVTNPSVDPQGLRPSRSTRSCRLQRNISETERTLSAAGGALCTLLGASRGGLSGLIGVAIGAGLLYRGATGHCHGYDLLGMNNSEQAPTAGVPARQGVRVEESVVVRGSAHELYSYWRELENLPRLFSGLTSVEVLDRTRSHWIAEAPLGQQLAWDAELIADEEGRLISWRSLPGSQVANAGSVRFEQLTEGREPLTRVLVSIKFNPPGGAIANLLADAAGEGLAGRLQRGLEEFRQQAQLRSQPEIATATPQRVELPGEIPMGDS